MADPEPDLASCLERVASGDEDAARELVTRCLPLVVRIVRAHHPRTLGRDDLAQEVFLKMFTQLHRYEARDGVPFPHWLSRVAVRTCLDALRAERRRPGAFSDPLTPAAEAHLSALRAEGAVPPDDAVAARDLVELLLGELPPADRLVLTLLDLEERSVAEVAASTGWSTTLVKVRAFRARRRLRAAAERLAVRRPA